MFLAVSMNVSPLRGAGAARGEVERVGPEPPGGQAEADARARGRLEEEVDDDLALQVVALGRVADADAEEPLGGVEQPRQFRGGETFEPEQVLHGFVLSVTRYRCLIGSHRTPTSGMRINLTLVRKKLCQNDASAMTLAGNVTG